MPVIKKPKPPKKANGRPKIKRDSLGRRADKHGRPSVVTKEVIEKLEQAFMIGCTDVEACLFANISPAALYLYQNKNPEYIERKDMLKKTLNVKAKANLANSINRQDVADSKWHLERRARDEYSVKTDHDVMAALSVTGTITHEVTQEHRDMLKRLIKDVPGLVDEVNLEVKKERTQELEN